MKASEGTPETTPPKKRSKKKCTKLEKIYRIRKLQRMCASGFSPLDLEEYCQKEWGLSAEYSRNFLKEVYDGLASALSIVDKRTIALTAFLRLEHAYKMAFSVKDPSAMVRAVVAQAALFVERAPDENVASNMKQRTFEEADEDF